MLVTSGLLMVVIGFVWRWYLNQQKNMRMNRYGVEEFDPYGGPIWNGDHVYIFVNALLYSGIFLAVTGLLVVFFRPDISAY